MDVKSEWTHFPLLYHRMYQSTPRKLPRLFPVDPWVEREDKKKTAATEWINDNVIRFARTLPWSTRGNRYTRENRGTNATENSSLVNHRVRWCARARSPAPIIKPRLIDSSRVKYGMKVYDGWLRLSDDQVVRVKCTGELRQGVWSTVNLVRTPASRRRALSLHLAVNLIDIFASREKRRRRKV